MVKIKLETILHNNDKIAIQYLKDKKLYNTEEYEKEIKTKIVNEFDIDLKEDNNIDYVLKKLSFELFNLLDIDNNKNDKHCFYCFESKNKDTGDKNEIIKVSRNIKIDKITKIEDIDDMDIDEDFSDIEIDDDELSDISDLDLSDIEDMEGGSRNKNNIFICKNCKKIYFFNKYFNYKDSDLKNYNDIFPFPELFYMRNKEEIMQFSLIDNQRKKIEYIYNEKNITSPYNELKNINKTFLVKNKQNALFKYLDSYSLNNGKHYKYINNNSFMLLNNFNSNDITITYFPELCLYKKNNEYKLIDLYSKLYYPNVNFENYYLKFINQIDKKDYNKGLLKNFEINKREINDDIELYTVEQLVSEYYGKDESFEGWGIEIENQEIIERNMDKIKDNIKVDQYINKIFYKINDNIQNTSLINFSLVYHLLELDEQIPFFTSYLAEEGVMLEKYYKPLKDKIEKLNINIKNKKIIRFLLKMPEEILNDGYFYVNLYENLKMEVTVTLSNDIKKYITKKDLLLINKKVNDLINKINDLNVFTFNDLKIPLSETNIDKWNESNTSINSLNINFELKNYDIDNINKKIRDLSKCMKNTYIIDFNKLSNNFRYIKINNIDIGVLTDRYIFYKIKEIIEIDNTKTENEIEDYVIYNMMIDFQKNFYECFNIYKNYLSKYKNANEQLRIPINYGVYFNIKKDEDTNNYIINIFGLRKYEEIEKMKIFISKMFYIFKYSNDNNVKKILDTCNILIQKEKVTVSDLANNILLLNKKYRKCINNINELKNSNDYKIKKSSYDKKIKDFEKIRKQLNKKIEEKEKITKHTKILKRLQDVFPNLKYKCGDTNIKQYTKSCQGRKQPMGTGSGIYEEVIDFNSKYENERLDKLDNITCSIDIEQKGGNNNIIGKYRYIDYCNYFNFVIKERKNYIECYKEIVLGEAKGKKIIQNISKEIYDIDSNKKKIKYLLNEINNKILSSKVNFSNYNIYLNKVKNSDNDFLIEYYSSNIHNFSLDIKDNLEKLSLGIMKKKVDKYTLFKFLIDQICIENNKKVLQNFILLLDIEKLSKKIISNNINIRLFLIYIIIYIFNLNKIKENEYRNIFKYLNKNIDSDYKIVLDAMLYMFYEVNLLLNDNNKKIKIKKEKEINETSLKELMGEVNDLIIKKDKNNHITDSVLNYKGKALTCPNYSDDNNPNKPLIGFLDISKFSNKDNLNDNEIRDLVCQPCCFVQKYDKENDDHIITKRYRKNMLFCKSKISWNKYLDLIENETRIEGYIYSESLNINNTYGILPINLYNLFNRFINLMNLRLNTNYDNFLFNEYNSSNRVLKGYGYVLRGYEQKNNIFMTIIEDILNMNKNKIINNIKNKLMNTKKLFNILNEGKLKIRFKTIDNYINYINGDDIDYNWLIDILSYPNILDEYKNGINILIFKKEDEEDEKSDIQIIKYKYLNMIDYFNKSKPTIFLYEYNSGALEPIVLKTDNNYYGIFPNYDKKLDKVNKKYNIDLKVYFENFINIINQWINESFKNNYLTSKQIMNMKNINLQLVDNFYNVNYLIDNDDNLIPVIPSSIDINSNYKIFKDVNDLDKYLKTFNDTYKFLINISKDLNKENYIGEKIILDDDKKYIVGIELRNNLIIPIKKEKYDDNKNYEISRISNKFLYYKINNVLYDNIKLKEDIEFIKEKYDIEIYQRFLLEISNHLDQNQQIKDNLKILVDENNKEKLFEYLINILDNIITYKEEDLLDYRNINDNSNIRTTCNDNTENKLFCKNNKLVLPYNKKNFIYGLFIENLLNNDDFRIQILNNNINKIIDINKYINDDKHIYVKKDVDF